ncbi:hypothetical protein ABT224_10630 [Streptomyces sp. NPDC001584]|uniref:hypothetical protein n=1 Tax=Streptomyces sp. NPDC001584 TaxID=3154521 RepID=UPI003318B816
MHATLRRATDSREAGISPCTGAVFGGGAWRITPAEQREEQHEEGPGAVPERSEWRVRGVRCVPVLRG